MNLAERNLRAAKRWRAVFGIAALLVPALFFALFDRQAKRLEALSEFGVVVAARVTGVSANNHITFYGYQVDGVAYQWDAKREDAPYALGAPFSALYLPSEPSFSRPTSDRRLPAAEAVKNRQFTWRFLLGLFVMRLALVALTQSSMRRLTAAGAGPKSNDPLAYRQQIVGASILLFVAVAGVTGFHVHDAMAHQQSICPIIVGGLFCIAIVSGVFAFVSRAGPQETCSEGRQTPAMGSSTGCRCSDSTICSDLAWSATLGISRLTNH